MMSNNIQKHVSQVYIKKFKKMSNAKNNAEQRALLKIVPYHITQPLQNQMPNSHIWWIFELKLYLDVSKGELKKNRAEILLCTMFDKKCVLFKSPNV